MPDSKSRKLAAILFADLVGYTAIMQANEEGAARLLKQFQTAVKEQVTHQNGRVVNFYGDGALNIFDTPVQAMQCALALQTGFQREEIPVRIGVHSGTIVFDGDQVYGDSVNLASRIESMAIPGSILFSERVRVDIKNHPEFKMNSLGAFEFKNVQEPMEIFALANPGVVIPRPTELQGKTQAKADTESSKKWLIPVIIGGLILLAGFIWFWGNSTPPANDQGPVSLVVLPFKNLSAGEDQEFLSDGISEEILNALTKVPDLKIIGRSTAFSYKGKGISGREIGQQLQVSHVLEGTVRKTGDQLKIFTELSSVADGFSIWSENFEGEGTALFNIQNQITEAIVDKLNLSVGEEEKAVWAKHQPKSIEAYELYLKGIHFMNLRISGAQKAMDLFKEVIAMDPDFAPAYVGLGIAYLRLGFDGMLPKEEALQEAKTLASTALKLDDELAEAYILLARISGMFDMDWLVAKPYLEKALELNPKLPDVYKELGNMKESLGDFNGSLEENLKAVALDPLNPRMKFSLSVVYMLNRRYDEAIKEAESILEIYPNYSDAYRAIGEAYFSQGKYQQAQEHFQKGLVLTPESQILQSSIAMCEALLGRKEKLEELIEKQQEEIMNSPRPLLTLTAIHGSLGQLDSAFYHLEKFAGSGSFPIPYLERMPLFQPLWDDPRFQEIIDKYRGKK